MKFSEKCRKWSLVLLLTTSYFLLPTSRLYSAPWWDLRFTDGDNGTTDTAIVNMLENYILGASSMVYLANYSVPSANTKITTSMNNRDTAGLDVKYVGDGDEGNYTGLQAGIPYKLDATGTPIMHNKILIIDPNSSNKKLVTGSGNYTAGGWGKQDSAWLTITDSGIINKYLAEFNELFGGTFHGGTATSNPITTANGSTVHTLFSSEDQPWLVGNKVDTTIRAATESVFFETTGHDPTNSGTLDIDEAIWSVLDDGGKSNFFCEGVVNSMGGNAPTFSGTALDNYNSKGGYIRQSAVTAYDKHHSKYVVVDMDWLGVGSVNASKASSEYSGVAGNDENHIFINDFRLARAFMKEFSRHYKEDATVGSKDNSSVTEIHDWTAPDAPTNLSVTSTANSFKVTWTKPADPNNDFSRYYVFISTNNTIDAAKSEITEGDGSFRASTLRPEMQTKVITSTSATLTSYNEGDALATATKYYIGVVSVDKFGNESATALKGGPYQLGGASFPNDPASLGQFKNDGTTAIAEGGTTDESTVKFKATVTESGGGDVKLKVEVKPAATAFDGLKLIESAFVASGSVVTLSSTSMPNDNYHWRAVAVDTNSRTSDWVEFGTSGNTDFKVNYTAPNTAPGAPTVTAPNGGEKWKVLSTTHTITWTAATDPEGNTLTYQIDYSKDTGANWSSVASGVSGTSYNWEVPNTASTQCYVRIRAYDGALYGNYDQSDAVFTIFKEATTATDHLVISQIMISSNVATCEFVELYNPTDAEINLETYPVGLHIKNSAGTDGTKAITWIKNTIPAHGYFLIAGTNTIADIWPSPVLPDATYTSKSGNTLGTGGCVYIIKNSTIDLVGMGKQPSPGYETAVTTSPADGKSIERKPGSPDGNGTDTDNNFNDFMYSATSSTSHPRNTSTPAEPALAPNLAPSTPTVTAPNGGESWTAGTTQYISWTASTDPEGKSVTYQLDYSIDNGGGWTSVTASTSGTIYQWTVPDTPSTNCLVRIRASDGVNYSGYDQSDSTFTIAAAPPKPNDPPTEPTDGTPSDIVTWVNDNTPTFKWKFNDPNLPDDSQSYYRWQADEDAGYESINYDTGKKKSGANSHIPSSPLADGFWYWRVMVWDQKESSSPWSITWGIKIDATPPTTIVDLSASLSGKDVVLTWSAPNADISGLKNYRIYRAEQAISDDNKYLATSFGDDNVTGFTDTTANSGTVYYYAVTTLDNAGNESSVSNNVQITTPGTAVRKVVINELAIKGTKASYTNEWIELYNTSEYDIDLTGWTLIISTAAGGVNEIPLSMIISAGGYALLETTTDVTVSDIKADQIYKGDPDLKDGGATVTLKDKNGYTVDSVSYLDNSGGWPDLDTATDQTLERRDANVSGNDSSNWALNDTITRNGKDKNGDPINGTPKNLNSAYMIQLSNWSVTPATGTVSQTYTYSVLYKNYSNTAPDTKQVIIDGGAIVGNMNVLATSSYDIAGATCTFETTSLSTGVHNYYFYFAAGAYTRYAPTKAPNETFPGPWVGSDLEKVSMYGGGSTNPNPTTNPTDGDLSVQLPQNGKLTLYAYLKPGGENGWTVYGATITYWTTTLSTKTATMKYLGTENDIAKFYISLSSGTDYKAGEYFYYYLSARDTNTDTPFKFTDDMGDTTGDRYVSSEDTNYNVFDSTPPHYFKFGTASGGESTFEYKIVKRDESSADWTVDGNWTGGNNWTGPWRSSNTVEYLENNRVYNNEDVGVGISVSPGGTAAACTFYYTINDSTPTTADWKFSSAESNNFNKTTTNDVSDFKLYLPADINSAGTTIYVLAVIKDNSGVIYNSPKYIFKYGVTATPGEPLGDKTAIVLGRGNRDGKYPTTDFGNYSPLRHFQDEIIKPGEITKYLMPNVTDNFTIDSSFLTQPQRDPSIDTDLAKKSDGFLDMFYADPVKFYLRTAYRDSADIDSLGTSSEASLVWKRSGVANWSYEQMQVNNPDSFDCSDDQSPHRLKYHWLATPNNTALQGNPPDCTKGVPEGATVQYVFKVRDKVKDNSSDFKWIYRDKTTKKQRLTDSESTAKADGNQFEYKIMQDDYTRPVAYMPKSIPGVTPAIADGGVVPSTYTAPSWPAVVLGDTVTISGSTVETVKVYIGLFDTADGRFTYGSIASTSCISNSNYRHRTFADPNITNANYFGNGVPAINTSTNTTSSGIKGGRQNDNYEEGLEGHNSEGRRVTHDVLCYYVWRNCGSNTGSMINSFSWIDRDGTINNDPKNDPTGIDPVGYTESGTDLVNQMIRIGNVDGATDDSYVTDQSSAATKGWISGRVSMSPFNIDPDTGNGIWVAEIPAPADSDLQFSTSAVSFLYYRIWACNGDNDPQAYNTEIHGGSLMSSGLPSSFAQCQPHEEVQAQFGTQTLDPFGKTFVNVGSGGTPCPCGRVHDRDYGWVDITRYGGRITSPPRVMIKSKVTVGGVTRTITTYLKVDPTTRRPTNIISTQVGAE